MTDEQKTYPVSEQIQNLIKVYKEAARPPAIDKSEQKIQVSEFASRMAFVYEKIRNFIGNEQRHLFRKNAIKRIIKRRGWYKVKNNKTEELAKELIHELIWAKYLENGKVPVGKISSAEFIINKYRYLLSEVGRLYPRAPLEKIIPWLEGLMSCEIEEELAPPTQGDALVFTIYEIESQNINLIDKKLSDEDKEIQLFVAMHRAVFGSDRDMIRYQLFKFGNPEWLRADQKIIRQTADRFDGLYNEVEEKLKYPLRDRLYRVVKQKAVPYQIIQDIIRDKRLEAEQIFADPDKLLAEMRRDLGSRYQQTRSTLHRSMIRSILYVFLTKMSLALIVEVPFDKYYEGLVNYTSLAINIIVPPLIMFIVTILIRVPSEKNTERIISLTDNIVYGSGETQIVKIKKSPARGFFLNFFIYAIYLLTFFISFGLIVYALQLLAFNPVSIAIFILFLCMIAYFGFRIRQSARELVVLRKKENFFSVIIDFLAMPIVRVGRWINVNFSKVNIFVFIFDFIIEAPYKVLVQIMEEWLDFVREKKEELKDQD